MPDVTMPRLSDSMEEGTILRWLKADGDHVRAGDELAEIETDKATMTYEAEAEGVLRIVAKEGDTLPVGEVIATLGGAATNGATATPAAATAPVAAAAPEASRTSAAPAGGEGAGPAPAAPAPSPPVAADDVKASPVARRMAREKGIDLTTIKGTGPGGRIVKTDVAPEEAPVAAPSAAAPQQPRGESPSGRFPQGDGPLGPSPGTAKGDVTVQEPTRAQQVVARRMAESKATIPDFSIQTVADMSRAIEARGRLKAISGAGGEPPPSYNDLIVKAAALALREFPRANGSYRDSRFELYSRVNVGIAVAAHDALVVPTIFDADRKGLRTIASEARALAQRVRDGVITPPELSGGTFTVSNLGMYGCSAITPVINPPQAAILGVGAIDKRNELTLTLVCDHRILYGADAARFLARIRELLEEPLSMAL